MNKIHLYYNPSIINFGSAKVPKTVSKFISIEKSDYHPFIKETMKRLTEYDVEHGIIFTRDGRLMKEVIGDKESPFSSFDWRVFSDIMRQTPGSIFLHNHPDMDILGKPRPVTFQDAFYAAAADASEVIAVHPDGTYSSIKCLPHEEKFSCHSHDKFSIILLSFNADIVEACNKFGKVREEFIRNRAKEAGIIYTNTYTDYAA